MESAGRVSPLYRCCCGRHQMTAGSFQLSSLRTLRWYSLRWCMLILWALICYKCLEWTIWTTLKKLKVPYTVYDLSGFARRFYCCAVLCISVAYAVVIIIFSNLSPLGCHTLISSFPYESLAIFRRGPPNVRCSKIRNTRFLNIFIAARCHAKCKRRLCRHVCLSVCHVRGFCQNE